MRPRFMAAAVLGLLVTAPLWGVLPAAAAGSAPPTPTAVPTSVAVTASGSVWFPSSVAEAAYSPNGQYIAVATEDGPVTILNATDFSVVVNLTTDANWISPSSLSWSPGSDKLAVGYTGGAVAVWRIPSGLWAWSKGGLFYEVKGISWSPDGRFLAAGVVNSVFIYTGESGNLNATMHMNYGGSQPAGLSWSHDSDYIAVGQQAYAPQGALLVVFDTASWGKALQWRWDGPLMDEVAFEGRARFLSVQLGGSRIEVWSVRNWTRYASITTQTGVEQSAWTSDGSRLVMLESEPSSYPNTTTDFGGFELLRLGGGDGNATALTTSPDGRHVAVGRSSGELVLLTIGTDRFFDDATPLRTTTGETLPFAVRYTGTAAAAVHWRDSTGTRTGTAGLAAAGVGLGYAMDVPSDWDGSLFYHFEAPGDGVSSPEREVRVLDNDPPVVLDYNFTRTGPGGDTAVARVAFSDNLEIGSARFTLAVDGVQKAEASGGGTNTLNFTLSVPVTPANTTVRMNLDATDAAGNGGRLLSQTYTLDDLTPPTFGADLSQQGTAGGRIQLGIEARDERGPPLVTVTWRELSAANQTDWQNLTYGLPAVGSVAYLLSVPVARETVAVEYWFEARDAAGNTNRTATAYQTVKDVVPPQAVADLSDQVAFQGQPFNLSMVARDNVGVASVTAIFQQDGGTPFYLPLEADNSSGTQVWKGTRPVSEFAHTINYQFVVTDSENNSIYWGYRLLRVQDLTPPTVNVTNPTLRVIAGDDFTLQVAAHDNEAVTAMVFYWARNCSGPFFSFQVPVVTAAKDVHSTVAFTDVNVTTQGDGRPVCFYIFAFDAAGNLGQLGGPAAPQVIQVIDGQPPNAKIVRTGEAVQGFIVTFDGSLSTDDIGIVQWQWKVEGQVVGDRPVLEWRFNDSGGSTVTLTVWDAAGSHSTDTTSVTVASPPPTSTGVGDVTILVVVAAAAAGVVVGFWFLRKRPPEEQLVDV